MSNGIDIENLFEKFHLDIYHFSLYFSSNKQDAEDITQETFLKAIRNIHMLKDRTRAKYWLLSIARNTAIDHLRKKKLKSTLPELLEKITYQDKKDSLDDYLLIKEQWEEVQNALLRIKPHYRSLLILRGIQEMTIKETAEILECSELKVRVDFYRAIKVLKKELHVLEGVNLDEKSRKSNSRG
ncbi:RNA polymerase sigma factor [Lederbergia citri]|uniref:RNA polymerase sigma factor n=1 Tax=Lederbergia citri TaxID=2833580 RepID=A0A942YGA6_9BACI|nr:RNA polymerase sigma factor [Lederbergia citri]MBS4194150.1 RNA polymerase sigma factor [Lederbergia citri]